jgi:hypothetical protein
MGFVWTSLLALGIDEFPPAVVAEVAAGAYDADGYVVLYVVLLPAVAKLTLSEGSVSFKHGIDVSSITDEWKHRVCPPSPCPIARGPSHNTK